jgi:hypothetical protein
MAKAKKKRKKQSNHTITTHLVLSTGEVHPPFIQEIAPGVIEKCVWDDSINGYRCSIIQQDGGQ